MSDLQKVELPPAQITPIEGGSLIQIGDKVYHLAELQSNAIQPQPVTAPTTIQPHPIKTPSTWKDDPVALAMWIGGGVLVLLAIAFLADLFSPKTPVMPVAPAPTASPVAPAQPQTIIVQPPPPAQTQPYTRETCKPAGFLWLSQECTKTEGFN